MQSLPIMRVLAMQMNFPRTVFVSTIGLDKQVSHVCSEAIEVYEESIRSPVDYHAMAEELSDLIHSAETCLRILAEREDIPIDHIARSVVTKNRRRRYYGEEEIYTG